MLPSTTAIRNGIKHRADVEAAQLARLRMLTVGSCDAKAEPTPPSSKLEIMPPQVLRRGHRGVPQWHNVTGCPTMRDPRTSGRLAGSGVGTRAQLGGFEFLLTGQQ